MYLVRRTCTIAMWFFVYMYKNIGFGTKYCSLGKDISIVDVHWKKWDNKNKLHNIGTIRL